MRHLRSPMEVALELPRNLRMASLPRVSLRSCRNLSLIVLAFLLLRPAGAAAQEVPGPSFRDVLSLRSVSAPAIAPGGSAIVFEVRSTEWKSNRYDTELWIARPGEDPQPFTRAEEGSSSAARWSPDGQYLAFRSTRDESPQLYILSAHGGEARPVTAGDEGVRGFRWGPGGDRIAFTRPVSKPDSIEQREERYGDYAIEDRYHRQTHLWTVDVSEVRTPSFVAGCDSTGAECVSSPDPRRLTDGDTLSVTDFSWSPDGERIAVAHKDSPALTAWNSLDLAMLHVETKELMPLVERPGPDGSPVWSPDGSSVFFETSGGDELVFYETEQYARVPTDGGPPTPLAEDFDANLSDLHWTPQGIYALAWQKTKRRLVRVDPGSGGVSVVGTTPNRIHQIDFSADGTEMAFTGQTASTLREIYWTPLGFDPELVTSASEQISDWPLGSSEVISWTSRDGTRIEGVLYRPANFDPSKKYPLLVNIHGGPTSIDYPQPFEDYVYPIAQWMAKGALILQPNYRGSDGYGEDFRSLNVRDLGTGDMKDVMSGVDHLIDRGIVDTTRMGAMGWSQGGYISAFLATNTDRFSAISVGAGISDWETYYVTTDIHPFTRQYLKATPWEDPAVYEKTSPISSIQQARTPTLIQHGENDARVPIPNAYKLYQGLRDQGVSTELIVYEGFGHGISKPKEQLAATWHNWRWFAKYLWGEDVPLPLGE